MKIETPATGIWIKQEFDDAVFFAIDCECGLKDHQVTFELEKVDNTISLNLYTTQSTRYFDNFFERIRFKAITTLQLWWHDEIKFESSTLLSLQQTANLAHYLTLLTK